MIVIEKNTNLFIRICSKIYAAVSYVEYSIVPKMKKKNTFVKLLKKIKYLHI